MIKVGDEVSPIHRMDLVGTVKEIRTVKPVQWMVGGVSDHVSVASVKFSHMPETVEIRLDELRQISRGS